MYMKNFSSRKIYLTFSNYSKNSSFFNGTNKKAIGKMKDESGKIKVKNVFNKKN